MIEKFSDLKKRFFLSTISIVIIATVLLFLDFVLTRFILAGFLSILSVYGCKEFIHFAKNKGNQLPSGWIFSGSVIIMLGFFAAFAFSSLLFLPFFLFFLFALGAFVIQFSTIEGALDRVASTLFPIIYITFPLGLILAFYNDFWGFDNGRFWLIYLLVITKGTDVFAYFGGKLLGKRKLSSQLSPKKTKEGVIIGVIFALVLSLLFLFTKKITLSEAIILGFLIGVLGQVGDLAESLLKRDAQVKDSSKIPGHGGDFRYDRFSSFYRSSIIFLFNAVNIDYDYYN